MSSVAAMAKTPSANASTRAGPTASARAGGERLVREPNERRLRVCGGEVLHLPAVQHAGVHEPERRGRARAAAGDRLVGGGVAGAQGRVPPPRQPRAARALERRDEARRRAVALRRAGEREVPGAPRRDAGCIELVRPAERQGRGKEDRHARHLLDPGELSAEGASHPGGRQRCKESEGQRPHPAAAGSSGGNASPGSASSSRPKTPASASAAAGLTSGRSSGRPSSRAIVVKAASSRPQAVIQSVNGAGSRSTFSAYPWVVTQREMWMPIDAILRGGGASQTPVRPSIRVASIANAASVRQIASSRSRQYFLTSRPWRFRSRIG